MKTITLPDGRKITYDGTLEEKTRILEMMGVVFTPQAAEQAAQTRKNGARARAKAIPNWASWTPEQWAAFFNANLSDVETDKITNIAIAKVMIKRQNAVIDAIAKMLMATRDELWSDLPDV